MKYITKMSAIRKISLVGRANIWNKEHLSLPFPMIIECPQLFLFYIKKLLKT